jgi:hypothetical protein
VVESEVTGKYKNMALDNPVIKLCIEGTQAEFQGQIGKARSLYIKKHGNQRKTTTMLVLLPIM